jgi:hypothetical protein
LLVLFICQIEACPVGHVHLEASRGEALSLLFVNACYLFFGMAYRSIVLLWILLHELILEKLLVILEFLAV